MMDPATDLPVFFAPFNIELTWSQGLAFTQDGAEVDETGIRFMPADVEYDKSLHGPMHSRPMEDLDNCARGLPDG